MSACSICMRQKSRCTNGVQPKLVVVETVCLSPDERTAFTLLSSRVATALLPDPARGELSAQCQTHGCTLDQAVVIATSRRGLPLILEAGIALCLRGAGYENETAADVVFQPRSSGGLAAAIEYACRLVA